MGLPDRKVTMRFFRNLSIKQKLTIITMLISIVALLFASSAFIIFDTITFRDDMSREFTIFAKVIGNNTAGALEFQDQSAAEEILSALSANEHIVSAALYEPDGEVLAKYHREGMTFTPPAPEKDGYWFSDKDLVLFQSVVLHGDKVGTVYLQSDLVDIDERLRRYALIIVTIMIAASLVAFLLASKLQGVIARPILHLVKVARRVSEEKDYSVRAQKHHEDEVGLLIDSFNGMLDQIQSRDQELMQTHRQLEDRVRERTKELQEEILVRQQAEEGLKSFTEKLERSNRELQDFAYICSHDLQEPLRKVIAFGDRLKSKCSGQVGEEGREYLERMQSASSRMQTLINDLLTFSRVTTQAKPYVPVDLAKIVQEVVSDLEVRIEQSGGRVEIDELATIDADPVHMRQLLQNLLGNALKFSKKGEPPVVKVSGNFIHADGNNAPGDEIYEITVEDNGIGFDEKYTDRIFGVFQRLHGRSEYEGTGIGLAVCRKIVERHGGSIIAKSNPGQGSIFIVQLHVKHHKGGIA